ELPPAVPRQGLRAGRDGQRHLVAEDAADEVYLGQQLDVGELAVGLDRGAGEDLAPAQPERTGDVVQPDAVDQPGEPGAQVAAPAQPPRQAVRHVAEEEEDAQPGTRSRTCASASRASSTRLSGWLAIGGSLGGSGIATRLRGQGYRSTVRCTRCAADAEQDERLFVPPFHRRGAVRQLLQAD